MNNVTIRRLLGSRLLATLGRVVAILAVAVLFFQCQYSVGENSAPDRVQLIRLYVSAAGDLAVYPERLEVGPNTKIALGPIAEEDQDAIAALAGHRVMMSVPTTDANFFSASSKGFGVPFYVDDLLKSGSVVDEEMHFGNKPDKERIKHFPLVSVIVKPKKDLGLAQKRVVPYAFLYQQGDSGPWYIVRGSEVEIDPNRAKRR